MQQGSSIPSWLLNEAVQSMKMINLQQLHVPSITLGQSVQCMLNFSCIISLKASQDWLLQIASNNVSWRSPGNQKLFNSCENHIYIEYWMEDRAWGFHFEPDDIRKKNNVAGHAILVLLKHPSIVLESFQISLIFEWQLTVFKTTIKTFNPLNHFFCSLVSHTKAMVAFTPETFMLPQHLWTSWQCKGLQNLGISVYNICFRYLWDISISAACSKY